MHTRQRTVEQIWGAQRSMILRSSTTITMCITMAISISLGQIMKRRNFKITIKIRSAHLDPRFCAVYLSEMTWCNACVTVPGLTVCLDW